MTTIKFRSINGTFEDSGITNYFNVSPELFREKIIQFLKLSDCPKQVDILVFLLKDNRGDRAIFSKNLAGSDDRFSIVGDNRLEDLGAYVIARRNEGYNFVIGFSKNCLSFIIENSIVSNYQILLFKTLDAGNCWICGKPIQKSASTVHLICGNHEIHHWDRDNYSTPNESKVSVNAGHASKLSFGVEFEISNCKGNELFLDDLQTVLTHHGWINTVDGSVFSEFKSPIYIGSLPFYWSDRNIFSFFDYCLGNHLLKVGDNSGTHLHIGSYDENKEISKPIAIMNKLRTDPMKRTAIEKFISALEIIIDSQAPELIEGVFGRIFNEYCTRYNIARTTGWSQKYSQIHLGHHQWINLIQSDSLDQKSRSIELRLPRFVNSHQYQKAYRMGIFIFNSIEKILFKNGNPFLLAEYFEKKLIKVASESKPERTIPNNHNRLFDLSDGEGE